MEVIKNKRILALVGISCLFLGSAIPYYKFTLLGYSYNISLWNYWEGKIIVILILANTMFIFKDYLQKYVPHVFNSSLGKKIENANSKLAIIPTILVALFVVYLTAHLNVTSEYIKHGLGFYTLWIGVVSLVGHVIFYKSSNPKEEINREQQFVYNEPQNNYEQPNPQSFNNTPQSVKYCPKCGSMADANATICLMCRNNF